MVADEWQKFSESTGFYRQSTTINETNSNDTLKEHNDQCLNLINHHLELRDELDKLFEDKISKIVGESNFEFNNDDQIPTLEQLIQNKKQTYDQFKQLEQSLKDQKNRRNPLCEELKSLQMEIDTLRQRRDQLLQKIDETRNVIKKKSSKISFRTHNNQLILLFFDNNDGRLQNFLIENKENSTKEDFWQDLCQKIL
ncbi:hypothetical protein BLA29_000359 [Euroglyphus maynei]|uniref:Uncharacterized protein n=1 Tax=Euroglyphus maynei TaxID=6958 RepID=A0A1Y3AQB3_EURMA|nr:hypothetical protein BLA29_000359 [Euroglyphus maynei]